MTGKGVAIEQPPVSAQTVIAGFIVWLAQRGIEIEQRLRCPVIAEQCLRWQYDQRLSGRAGGFEAYRAFLAHKSAGAAQLTETLRAVELLERYLESVG